MKNHALFNSLLDSKSMQWMGKIIFLKARPHQQRRKIRELTVAVILGVLLAAAVGLSIYFKNKNVL